MTSDPPPLHDVTRRLIDLESRFLLLEHDFESLNAAFIARGDELERLRGEIERLERHLSSDGGVEEPRSLEEDKPPHY